jgi:transposase
VDCASDMTDAEWALIARRLPPRRRLGRPREVDLGTVLQAILYILSTGCRWRALPKEFPPYSTVQAHFYTWCDTGRWQKIVTALVRQAAGNSGVSPGRRQRSSTVKVQRRPKPAAPEATMPANVPTGARGISSPTPMAFCSPSTFIPPTFRIAMERYRFWSDCDAGSPSCAMSLPTGFTAAISSSARLAHCGPWRIGIVERPLGVKGFQLLPRRWVVERIFAWFGRCRRLAKDFEGSAATEAAWLLVAHLRLLTRRLAATTKTLIPF